ncbi:DUF3270 family protein [Streptococcus timonensis]|uniref:DUF3270 family protein n=1 Tax=Streptococcus TaxID=1301 RepID=UPI0022B76E8E|nr:DUF3270 family protein [Streptococcus sp. SM5]
MPARKLQSYEFEQERTKTTQYQDYIPENTSVTSIKEVLFFVNIACFCVFLAIFSFVFLSLKLNTILSLVLAVGLSLGTLKIQRTFIKKRFK